MALLNPADQANRLAVPTSARLNWRLLLCLAGTLGFWVVVGEGVARAL